MFDRIELRGNCTDLSKVHKALSDNQLVVIPTDTVYGIAAQATSEKAVALLQNVKQRKQSQPTAIIFSSITELCADIEPNVRTNWAIRALLPGPWTLVIEDKKNRYPWLSGETDTCTLGVRVPAGAFDLPPIAVSSANCSGQPTATSIDELDPIIANQIAIAVDGGIRQATTESTILDLVAWSKMDGEIKVLRDTVGRAGQAVAVLANSPRLTD